MTSKERMQAAMRHQPVDRVPVMCQLSIGHYLLNTDVRPAELWFTSEGFARALITLQRRYRFDGILINLLGTDPDWQRHVARIETRDDGTQIVHFKNGDYAWCPPDDNVHYFPAGGRRRPTIEEVDPEKVYYDDPHSLGGLKYPYYFGLEPYQADPKDYWPPYIFRTVDMVLAEVGSEISVHAEVFSPWTQVMELFGYQQALLYIYDNPGKLKAIVDRYAEGAADLGVRFAKRGVDAVLISSAFAGGGFISPRHYEEFVLPYEKKVVDAIHAATGKPVYIHTCGAIGDRLELMAATGADGIDTLDPPPLGNVDLPDAKRRVGGRLFIKGNVDPVNTLLSKSRQEVFADAMWRLTVAGPGSGYILSSACSVAPRVPPENLLALVEASEAFGPPPTR
ncbi:MAG: uroporphyrinogen decarboxylase family protein [Thermoguttaceae bacterium]|nr:uroporphyrinogen decarboxylase family protein [Thermoguttaceae bacterium]